MNRVFAVVVLIAIAGQSAACINTFTTEFMRHKRDGDQEQLASALLRAEAAYKKSPTLENTNDLAVGLVLSGNMDKGIQILRELESSKPGNAVVAANLGTALELSGADAEALQWIGESVRRDPKEHYGSEWVHVKILEAKLALKQDPDWLATHSVLGWRLGEPPLRDEKNRPRRNEAIVAALQYQLKERTVFVSPPDAVTGDLYATLGDLQLADSPRPETIGPMYGHLQALVYGTVHEARIRKINADLQRQFDAHTVDNEQKQGRVDARAVERRAEQVRGQYRAYWVFGSLLVVVVGAFIWRFRRRGR
jgi:hypothetical protein